MAPSVAEVGGEDTTSTRHKPFSALNEAAEPKNDTHLAKSFKSDLISMRTLVTCTICDQLLYEPWTLQCGHTYCYSCLCQWFKQHQYRKTCPDCRTAVKTIPAPSFTIRQMIEIFISRVELLPPDESVEQHRQNIEAERIAVEIDKSTEDGLFKGCFKPSNRVRKQWVEADRNFVCSGCLHEYIDGESHCGNCNRRFEPGDDDDDDDDFLGEMDSFNGDDQELYDMEVDADIDDDDSDDEGPAYNRYSLFGAAGHRALEHVMAMEDMEGRRHYHLDLDSDEDEEHDDDDDDDTGSLRDFIESDSPPRERELDRSSRAHSESHISRSSGDDDSDDESIAPRRGVMRIPRRNRFSTVSNSSDNNDSDGSSSVSPRSAIEINSTPEHEDNESEVNYGYNEYGSYGGYSPLEEDSDDNSAEGSNSDTIQELDHEDNFRIRESSTSTPRRSRQSSVISPYSNGEDDSDNEVDQYDRDGDIEMSVSPDARQNSAMSESDVSDASDRSSSRASQFSSADLGPATVFHEEDDDDDDSDGSIRPPGRRRRLATTRRSNAQDEEDVTLTQLFTRPPTGQRTSPTFDSQRILQWHASMRGSPGQSTRTFHPHPRRIEYLPGSSSRPMPGILLLPRRFYGIRDHRNFGE